MKTSDTISKLAEALSKAQGGFKAVDRDRLNPFVGSTYATLAAVLEGSCEHHAEHLDELLKRLSPGHKMDQP